MRNMMALGLVLLSGMLLFSSVLQIYRCFNPQTINDPVSVRLVRIEGRNCPLYYPEGQ
ncbi:conserved exported protein of unknown function [Maridesulfovibrio hydrothermalis AM13 = DSM 14728]|uniref:Uncharacterized protein n=1 Tax=Maridesulfovibrio hydrothermalis AM13 = DSM 14728 TaxID=1121451 RepID=L0RDX7_9BACT|nr:conserved exported protein of unknown function [Maridesulfovibrio hydrothermalis AM13 = DSM 14728]